MVWIYDVVWVGKAWNFAFDFSQRTFTAVVCVFVFHGCVTECLSEWILQFTQSDSLLKIKCSVVIERAEIHQDPGCSMAIIPCHMGVEVSQITGKFVQLLVQAYKKEAPRIRITDPFVRGIHR